MSSGLAWGVAATGRIALEVGQVIRDSPDMHVAAVGSRDRARAEVAAQELGAPTAHGSYAELVEDPSVEAVYVATPHTGHAEVVEAALAAGKAVLCEKPLTASLAETERLVALARTTGTFLMEAMWMRFNPLVQRLASVAASGELGELRSLRASFGFRAEFDPAGRLWDPALGGGALLDLGIYPVSLARLLLGTPSDLQVAGSLSSTGVDAESTLALTFPGGARALLDQSLLTDLPGTALLVGSSGWAELSRPFHAPTRLVVQTDGEPVEHRLDDPRAGFVGELEEVARCRAEGRSQSEVMPLEETVAAMRVLEDARIRLDG
jgi:predicted dehydrogenase